MSGLQQTLVEYSTQISHTLCACPDSQSTKEKTCLGEDAEGSGRDDEGLGVDTAPAYMSESLHVVAAWVSKSSASTLAPLLRGD